MRHSAVWGCDFEFCFPDGPGGLPAPICATFRELNTGAEWQLWGDDLRRPCPVEFNRDTLFVAYLASAEFSCFLALGWPLPVAVFDCYVEFRRLTNGRPTVTGFNGLSDALVEFGFRPVDDKKSMRELAMRGGPFDEAERTALLKYNREDVLALGQLFPRLAAVTNMAQALHRGRYMRAVALTERLGVPIDMPALERLNERWDDIKLAVIAETDRFGLYEGTSFRDDRLERVIAAQGIAWPRFPDGRLMRDTKTFKAMADALPGWRPLYELRESVAKLQTKTLTVGRDGRNRAMLSPFKSRTARNQPSTSRFIYGNASWTRSLIKPAEGWGVAYLDWGQQEFAIAAALSGDENMRRAYLSGDPYLEFAKLAGAVPADATKSSHKAARDQFKATTLAVQYGMEFESLSERLGSSKYAARDLLALHKLSFPRFWRWAQETCDRALIEQRIASVHGWEMFCGTHPRHRATSYSGQHEHNLRSLMNWPMQTHGSEMMRLAMCVLCENGVRVVAPVHDAFLIEAPLADLDDVVEYSKEVMRAASVAITGGIAVKVDAELVRSPGRYTDPRGAGMWERVCRLAGISHLDTEAA
jgi:DNA polymerase-1